MSIKRRVLVICVSVVFAFAIMAAFTLPGEPTITVQLDSKGITPAIVGSAVTRSAGRRIDGFDFRIPLPPPSRSVSKSFHTTRAICNIRLGVNASNARVWYLIELIDDRAHESYRADVLPLNSGELLRSTRARSNIDSLVVETIAGRSSP